jgi:uncharacterized protein (TIGR00255 family)
MTGFGSARREASGLRAQVDLRSVNNRFFDFQTRLPRELAFLEGEIMERCKARLGRGRVNVMIVLERGGAAAGPRLNPEALAAYLEAADRLQAEHGFSERGSAAAFLALPELIAAPEAEPERESLQGLVMGALDEAIEAMVAMKEREGEALAAELRGRVDTVTAALSRVEAALPEARTTLESNLRARLAELLAEVTLDPQRLAQEVAILVDRSDVTEETVRLASHLGQFRAALDAGGEVAKKLGFLLQEILREANTIGSKAQALAVVQEVLLIKEETEKIREQIQNLE